MGMNDQSAAVATLRRPDLEDARFIVRQETSPEFVDCLNVEDFQVPSIIVVS